MKVKLLILGLFLVGFAFSTQAQSAAPGVKKRQVNQQKRIKEGVKSGELTGKEVLRLEKQQAKTQRAKKNAKSDGKVTGKERARLHHRQNRTSRQVARQKHDRQKRKNN
jgi:hypothetical protein